MTESEACGVAQSRGDGSSLAKVPGQANQPSRGIIRRDPIQDSRALWPGTVIDDYAFEPRIPHGLDHGAHGVLVIKHGY